MTTHCIVRGCTEPAAECARCHGLGYISAEARRCHDCPDKCWPHHVAQLRRDAIDDAAEASGEWDRERRSE